MGFTASEFEAGSIIFCQALDGEDKDVARRLRKVNGDFTNVKYAIILNEAGKRLMQKLRAYIPSAERHDGGEQAFAL